jgi:hypothetical protein
MDERRKVQRILANGLVYELNGHFLGFSVDLSQDGICLTVSRNFPHFESFLIQLKPIEVNKFSPLILKIKPLWRRSRNQAYDEIGAKILHVEPEQEWEELLTWYADNEEAIRKLSFVSARKLPSLVWK